MNRSNDTEWHRQPLPEIVTLLETDPHVGLEPAEAVRRLRRFGPNLLSVQSGRSEWKRFLLQFHQPLIYILLVSALITAFLKQWPDAGVIAGVVLVNAIIGFIQESRAEKALSALASTLVSSATVIRGGRQQHIEAADLVPGDVVLLFPGDKVPADLRLLESHDLQVNESALTGESLPVHKNETLLSPGTLLSDRTNMTYASTMVTSGQARGLVVATGDDTEVGRISGLIAGADDLATPLTRKIARFSRLLLVFILLLACCTVIIGLIRGYPLFDLFMAAVALAVGAIPEGLPAAVTITLAIGVARMAHRKAIIRKLPAVETLGSTTVICTDKTGTLTENQMTVQVIVSGAMHFQVSGTGYAPHGEIVGLTEADDTASMALRECLLAGILCNDSELVEQHGLWTIEGDPTEGALLVAAAKGGIDIQEARRTHPRMDTVPFDSANRFMATLHETEADGNSRLYVKGAVEQILRRCTRSMQADGSFQPLDATLILDAADRLAGLGLRVLAFAYSDIFETTRLVTPEMLDSDLVFLGLQGMMDPPRKEAVRAVAVCRQAGIGVKMITGDHPQTAAAIAGQIGIIDEETANDYKVMTGAAMERLSDRQLVGVAEATHVFARATPEQKIRLVRALQATGNIVAMTGDGVNDAPALKQADVGVAMGRSGTDVAREAADMVLTDDNFSSIQAAVEEGRGVFDNLTKFIVWTLPTNLGEGLVILVAILFGATLPILPLQILWINMTTAGFLGLMLAFEPKEPGIMDRPPRDPATPLLTRELITRILLVGTLLLAGSFGLFGWERLQGASLSQARTVAVNTFVVMELFYLYNCRSLDQALFRLAPLSNIWIFLGSCSMLLLQLAYTYLPFMNNLFDSTPINFQSWIRIVGAGIATLVAVELQKYFQSGFKKRSLRRNQ